MIQKNVEIHKRVTRAQTRITLFQIGKNTLGGSHVSVNQKSKGSFFFYSSKRETPCFRLFSNVSLISSGILQTLLTTAHCHI